MLDFLKNHLFAVDAFFNYSLVLTYAVPKEQLRDMIPACLELDTFDDTWAFVAVAIVQTKALRPSGFPAFLGNDFFLIGYRIFVRYNTNAGKRLRGLYILKSETDRKKMEFLGALFTKYRYTTTDINLEMDGTTMAINSRKSGLSITIDTDAATAALPPNSPFPDWKTARRYAGPLPFTFSYNPKNREVLIVEGMRENWTPTPVGVMRAEVKFLTDMNLTNAELANAFIINNIPYYWKRGRTEIWKE